MSETAELSPLFTEVTMSRDDANAIVAALRDVAESDGMHEEELKMIDEFVHMLDADLGETRPTKLGEMTPQKLAQSLTDPTLRTVAVQCAVLVALADGKISPKERECVVAYAGALGISGRDYERIEQTLQKWVSSGDLGKLL